MIAALNGHAIGIGMTIALQTDIRIIAADAKYAVAQVRRGVIPDCMAHWTLPHIAGVAAAAHRMLTKVEPPSSNGARRGGRRECRATGRRYENPEHGCGFVVFDGRRPQR